MRDTMGTTADPEFAIPFKETEQKSTKSRCVLNVTEQEYAKILQLNHDALVWNNSDKDLLRKLEVLLDKDIVDRLRQFEECRMEMQHDLGRVPRVQAS
jgi:hypothetical protein